MPNPLLKWESLQIEPDWQADQLRLRATQFSHPAEGELAVHAHQVRHFEKSLIHAGALLPGQRGEIVSVKAYDQRRLPKLPREAKAVSGRSKMCVQHVVAAGPVQQPGQAIKGGKALRLEAVF